MPKERFKSFLYFIAASPIYPFTNALPLNPIYPLYVLTRPIMSLEKIHPLFWIILVFSLITFSFSFIRNIDNPLFNQTAHFISLCVVLVSCYILIIDFEINQEDFLKITFFLGLIYSIIFLLAAVLSGVSFFDVGALKNFNFPGYPQRFSPVLILSFLIGLRSLKNNIFYLLPIILIFVMIFLTYTRSLYIALIASIIYLLVYFFIFKTSPIAKIIYLILTTLITSLMIFGYDLLRDSENLTVITLVALIDSIFLSLENFLFSSQYTEVFYSGTSEYFRMYFWSLALDIFYQYPILGTGFAGLYQFGFPEYGSVHSQWVDQLLRTGLLGTIIYIFCYLIILRHFFHKNPFFCAWIFCLIAYGFFNETTKEIPVGIIFFTMLNFAIYSKEIYERRI